MNVVVADSDMDDKWRPWWLSVLREANYQIAGIRNQATREKVWRGLLTCRLRKPRHLGRHINRTRGVGKR